MKVFHNPILPCFIVIFLQINNTPNLGADYEKNPRICKTLQIEQKDDSC